MDQTELIKPITNPYLKALKQTAGQLAAQRARPRGYARALCIKGYQLLGVP